MAPLFRGERGDRSPSRRWTDRLLGVAVGIVLGLGVLVYFVFVHSEGAIDAPQVDEGARTTTQARPQAPAGAAPAGERQATAPARKPRPVPVVRVIGGAPPTAAGPKQLAFRKGEKVRFEIDTDEPFAFEIRGLNVKQSIEQSSIISFPATKVGQFPVIASATLIGVADLRIKPPG